MEEKDNREINKTLNNGRVHFVLSYSYMMYLFAMVFGVVFDLISPLHIFVEGNYKYTGLGFIILGSLIIYWAQHTSNRVRILKFQKGEHPGFCYGPYEYMRSPTHFGLFIMTLGLAIVIQSLFSVFFVCIAYIVTRLFFLKKEEKILTEKYGERYIKYKNKTKSSI